MLSDHELFKLPNVVLPLTFGRGSSEKVPMSSGLNWGQRPGMHPDNNPMPFDGKRMIFGGFEVILDK